MVLNRLSLITVIILNRLSQNSQIVPFFMIINELAHGDILQTLYPFKDCAGLEADIFIFSVPRWVPVAVFRGLLIEMDSRSPVSN